LLVWEWNSVTDSALRGVNTSLPGEVLATLAFPGSTLPSGTPTLLTLRFRVRSIWTHLDTALLPELIDVATPSGAIIDHGSIAQDQTLHVSRRSLLGDNNANDRLDIGDVSIVQAMILGLQPVRSWDISGNDLNWNTLLDSGDAVKILRAAAGLDPQPAPGGEGVSGRPGSIDRTSAGLAGATLSLDREAGEPGERVALRLHLSGGSLPIRAAAFTIEYPPEALRLRGTGSLQVGSLVPTEAAVLWNVAPGQQDFAVQSGAVTCALSSSGDWSSPNGELATLIFDIQAGQTARHRWPIRLVHAELSPDGYTLAPLPPVTAEFVGRPARLPAIETATCRMTDLAFELNFTGEPDTDYTIEWSSDLERWEPLTILRSETGILRLSDPGSNATSGQRFYRIRQP
jgi:hypothetical protein